MQAVSSHGWPPLEQTRNDMSTTIAPTKGLEGIVAATSGICWIDGDAGVLSYRGIDIHELAAHSNFEETCFLLWKGHLPSQAELDNVRKELAEARVLDPAILKLVLVAVRHGLPMEVLRTAVSALSFYDPDENSNDPLLHVRKSYRLTSQLLVLVAHLELV